MGGSESSCCSDGIKSLLGSKFSGSKRIGPRKSTIAVTEFVRERMKSEAVSQDGAISWGNLLVNPDPRRSVDKSYKTHGLLAEGGFGKIYKAAHVQNGELRAIKQIKKSDIGKEILRTCLELEVMVKLDHPHIVKLLGDFSDLVGFPEEERRSLFREMMLAVSFCHDRGIAHRDLKLANCLLQEVGEGRTTKLIDFGLSSVRRPDDTDDTWMDCKIGTPVLVAPKVLEDASYGVACDCWSAGAIMKQKGFMRAESFTEDITKGPVRTDPLHRAEVDDEARDFILKLLVKDPRCRMNARAALGHPFLQPKSNGTTLKTWSETVFHARAHAFSSFSRFEKAVLVLATHQAKEEEIAQMRAIFTRLDTNNQGFLTKEELLIGLNAYGHETSKEQFDETFGCMDAASTGQVNYTAWLAATMQPAKLASEKALKEAFRFFDLDNDGLISKHDLKNVLGDDDPSVQSVFGEEGGARDTFLDESAFVRIMLDVVSALLPKPESHSGRLAQLFDNQFETPIKSPRMARDVNLDKALASTQPSTPVFLDTFMGA